MTSEFAVNTKAREELIDVTGLVQQAVSESGLDCGLVFCFVPHTTAAVTINENTDPDVRRDILHKLRQEIPPADDYRHSEGNADAHIKASLIGTSEMIAFEHKRLVLGRWQGIFFCEFDGPRRRRLIVRVGPFA